MYLCFKTGRASLEPNRRTICAGSTASRIIGGSRKHASAALRDEVSFLLSLWCLSPLKEFPSYFVLYILCLQGNDRCCNGAVAGSRSAEKPNIAQLLRLTNVQYYQDRSKKCCMQAVAYKLSVNIVLFWNVLHILYNQNRKFYFNALFQHIFTQWKGIIELVGCLLIIMPFTSNAQKHDSSITSKKDNVTTYIHRKTEIL